MTLPGEDKSASPLLGDASLDQAQFKPVPLAEMSLASDLLDSTMMADNAVVSRSKSELNSKDEI